MIIEIQHKTLVVDKICGWYVENVNDTEFPYTLVVYLIGASWHFSYKENQKEELLRDQHRLEEYFPFPLGGIA